jgi:hypothetical protein
MTPMKIHYDAGKIYGEEHEGLMACTRSNRWYVATAPSPVTTDPGKVTCKKCLRFMRRETDT